MNEELVQKFGKTKRKGDIIFCEFEPGSTVFFIQAGAVRLTKIVGDKEKTLAIIGDGEIFGEMAILEKAPRSATAIAEDDVTLLEFNIESFAQLVKAQPSIAIKLLQTLSARIQDQNRKFKIINLPDQESKIMDVFLMLAEKKGIHADDDSGTNVEFTAETSDIANWAGLPETDCDKILQDMENHNKIARGDKTIKITNLYQFYRHVSSKRQAMEREGDG